SDRAIDARYKALIRLVYMEGMDKLSCPAIVCCGGRMDFHGAPMSRTWVKLGATAKKDDSAVKLAEPVQGWRAGDRVVLTATQRDERRKTSSTEERMITAINGTTLTLDRPLLHEHLGDGEYRGEVANL